MDKNDVPRFQICIRAMFASFRSECIDATLHGYWIGLSDLTIEQVESAVAHSIRVAKFLPRPAELREYLGVNASEEDTAIDAWSDVLRALRLGPYKHIDFQDKLCNAVIRNLGGWVTFLGRFSDAESEKWARLEFIKCYVSFAKVGVNGEMIAPLAGLSEREVHNGMLCLPIPRQIACDAKRAELPYITHFKACEVPKIERQVTE